MERIYYSIKSYNTFIDLDGTVTREEIVVPVDAPFSEENLAIAQSTAIDGEYIVQDDGVSNTEESISQEARILELERMMSALLGVTE